MRPAFFLALLIRLHRADMSERLALVKRVEYDIFGTQLTIPKVSEITKPMQGLHELICAQYPLLSFNKHSGRFFVRVILR